MKNVINVREIIKDLNKRGLNISDKALLSYHIKNFNYNSFIYEYSEPFFIDGSDEIYDKEAYSDELVHLYKFDHDLANHILRFILVIEKIINTNIVYEVINFHNITDKCMLKLDQKYIEHKIIPNLKDVEPRTSYFKFIQKLIKFLPTNRITRRYCAKNTWDEILRWRECPLDIMCLTWSFSTTLSFFIALSDETQRYILSVLDLRYDYLNGFIDFLKAILNLRNEISHNHSIYNHKIHNQSPALLNLYAAIFNEKINDFKLIHLMQLIEHFSHSSTLISNSKYYYNKLKIQDKFKQKIDLFNENKIVEQNNNVNECITSTQKVEVNTQKVYPTTKLLDRPLLTNKNTIKTNRFSWKTKKIG